MYVNLKEFERAIVFVPAPAVDSIEEHPSLTMYRAVTLPEGAVVQKWTDQFALAQELTYRYSYVKTLAIERHLKPPYFTAKVKVLIKSTQRWAYGGKPQDIPDTPAGFILWKPSPRSGFGGWGCSGRLPPPNLPAGKVVTPSLTIGAISRLALDYLRNRPQKKTEHAVIAEMAYDHLKGRWYLGVTRRENGFPEPESLSWSYGLKGKQTDYVLDPSHIRSRKPDDKTETEKQ